MMIQFKLLLLAQSTIASYAILLFAQLAVVYAYRIMND